MKLLKLLEIGVSLVCAMLLCACSNPFQDMEHYYNDGNYLEAAEKAVEGIRTPELKPQIIAFLESNGEKLVEKALIRGQLQLRHPSEKNIRYFQALGRILDEMILQEFPIPKLIDFSRETENFRKAAVKNYVANQYELGVSMLKRARFRSSIHHFENIEKYSPNYQDSAKLLRNAITKATRRISVSPFFKPADFGTQLLGDLFTHLLSGGKRSAGRITMDIRIGSIEVVDLFNESVMQLLNKYKSKFLKISMDDSYTNIDHTHYYVDGIIDASSDEKNTSIHKATGKNGVKEDYIRVEYIVKVTIESGVFLTETDEQISHISFSEYETLFQDFKGSTIGFVPRDTVVERAIQKASYRFAREFLDLVDRDNDPYSYRQ